MRTKTNTIQAKRLAIIAAALGMLLSGLFLTAPSAEAAEEYGPRGRSYVTATPIRACIETATVQGAEQARDLRAGQMFIGDDDKFYEIATGGDCKFDCHDGFDINCDGIMGDFCAVEIDREKVSDVNKCLTTLALAAANAAGTGVLN